MCRAICLASRQSLVTVWGRVSPFVQRTRPPGLSTLVPPLVCFTNPSFALLTIRTLSVSRPPLATRMASTMFRCTLQW